jgi:hypothetical protein
MPEEWRRKTTDDTKHVMPMAAMARETHGGPMEGEPIIGWGAGRERSHCPPDTSQQPATQPLDIPYIHWYYLTI